MNKMIEKSYKALIFVFFILFILLIRLDATANSTLFAIGLMIGSIVLAIIPFFINKCKKISVRRWYLMTMVSLSAFVFLQAIFLLLFKTTFVAKHFNFNVMYQIFKWLLIVNQAMFICFCVCGIIYTVKDFFKKNYSIQKFDLDAIMMMVNQLAYIATIYIVFAFSGYDAILHYDYSYYSYFVFDFGNDRFVLNSILITLFIYLCVYVTIELIKYYKFESIEDNSNNIYK